MIIESALDNDLYKLTMMQAILHQFPSTTAEYTFKCRTPGIDFRPYVADIIKNINKMCRFVVFTGEDIDYLSSIRFFKSDFLDFLRLFKFNYDYIYVLCDDEGQLHIHVKGPWLHTILFEVPVLSIVSEVYSIDMSLDYEEANRRSAKKFTKLHDINEEHNILIRFSEFGGRRRHSITAHNNAIMIAKKECPENLLGTSNVMMAKKHNIKAMGTMAHEWGQAHQALYRIEDSQFMMMENWSKEYRGELGIALSDVVGLKYFLYDFDKYFSKLFDGTRQDSGEPNEYASKLIQHYKRLGIDPKIKTIVFSDGLTIDKAIQLYDNWGYKIGVTFGIGTHITNDFDFQALQLVLKMTKCNGRPVAKLSDSPGKTMCTDQSYLDYLRTAYDRRIKGV
jgi:nicotinate phosphoribosyltransferase